MTLSLTEEQDMLSRSVAEFVADRASLAQFRSWRERTTGTAFDPTLWREIAEMGWCGIALDEAHGGSGLGFSGLGLVLEQFGRHLSITPMNATVLAGATAISLMGTAAQKKQWLPVVASGELTLTLAWDEGAHFSPWSIATRAERVRAGWRLTGVKRHVEELTSVDQVIVVAREASAGREGLAVFMVPRTAKGVSVVATPRVDARHCGTLTLDGVMLDDTARLGGVQSGAGVSAAVSLERLAGVINAGLAAELHGVCDETFTRTLKYLKERTQFGKLIGSYQALQHRAAYWFVELQLARTLVQEALLALDKASDAEGYLEADRLSSMAKAKLSQVAELSTNEAIQMHGGIGMTDAFDIGLYIKRARVLEQAYGDQHYHLDRLAALEGY
ncbi:MAG: acyl-CoA dehydrogenase [Gammaproteobacteria bacterium]|nr:acyl-CoA dehydrogenase [Gammaproteobacteria bacterium]